MGLGDLLGDSLLRRFALRALLGAVVLSCLLPFLGLLKEAAALRQTLPDRLDKVVTQEARRLPGILTHPDDAERIRYIDNLLADPSVGHVTLLGADGRFWSAGVPGNGPKITRQLHHPHNGTPATLMVQGALSFPFAHLLKLAPGAVLWTLGNQLLLVLIATLIAAFFAIRPARGILAQAAAEGAQNGEAISVSRGPWWKSDELDDIAKTLSTERAITFEAQLAWADHLVKIAQLNEELSDTQQDHSYFIYSVTHDLKSPINTARMLLSDLRQQATARKTLDEDETDILDSLDSTAAGLSQLIQDVIEYAIIASRQFPTSDVDLETEIHAVVQVMAPIIDESDAEVSLRSLPRISGNPFHARALFQALISNALKYHAKGSKPVVEIFGQKSRIRGWVEINVRDNGIGIAPQYFSKIFDIFTRLHRSSDYPGSGIGLTLCHRIVTYQGGRIEVDSAEGEGTTITVFLPAPATEGGKSAPAVIGRERRLLQLGVHTPNGHLWNQAGEGFAVELAELSGGRHTCKVMTNLRMTTGDDILDRIRTGALDLAFVPVGTLCGQFPDYASLLAPFLADDVSHAGRILRSDPLRTMVEGLEARVGIIGAGVGMSAMRQIVFTGDRRTRADLAGMKMGILPHAPISDFFALLGIEEAPMPMQQVPYALASGQIEAVDGTSEMAHLQKLPQYSVNILRSNHTIYPFFGAISTQLWQSLNVSDRVLIQQLLAKHANRTIDTYRTADPGFISQLRAAGCEVTDLSRRSFAKDVEAWTEIWHERSPSLMSILKVAEQTR